MKTRLLISFVLWICAAFSLGGQTIEAVDDLISQSKALRDSVPAEALEFARQAITAAQTIGYRKGESDAYVAAGRAHKEQGQWLQAEVAYLSALPIRRALGDSSGVASIYNNLSSVKQETREWDAGILYARQALRLWAGDAREANVCNNLANLLAEAGRLDSAVYYNRRAMAIARASEDAQVEAEAVFGLANRFLYLEQYDSAKWYFQQAEALFMELNLVNEMPDIANSRGFMAFKQQELDSARIFFEQARAGYTAIGDSVGLGYAYYNLMQIALAEGGYGLARAYKDTISQSEAFQDASARQLMATNEAVIDASERQSRRAKQLYLALAGIALLFGGILYNLQRLKAQKIVVKSQQLEIENQRLEAEREKDSLINAHILEKQQTAADATDAERERIGEELHAQINPLYAVKWRMEDISQHLPPDQKEAAKELKILVKRLSQMHSKIRTLSHELSTPSNNWPTDIRDFCNGLMKIVKVRASINFTNISKAIPPKMGNAVKIMIYNLIGNTVKHAKAQELIINIVADSQYLRASVEDDGQGFDPNAPAKNKGRGLAYIREEVAKYGGTFSIESMRGEGSRFYISIPLPKPDEEAE